MPSQISEAQSQILHEHIVPDFLAMLEEAPTLADPAEVEHLAAVLLVPLEQPEIPPEVGFAVVEAIAARCDADAAGVLAALAVLATEPLAGHARATAQRLANDGIVSPATGQVGTLAVQQAARIQSKEVELLIALLARPDEEEVQAAILGIEHENTGGALVDCALTPPTAISEARELLDGADGTVTQPIAADELGDRVRAAARRAIDAEVALGPEAGPALPVVSRALTGDPAGLPRPSLLAPWEQDDPELIVDAAVDEEGFHRLMDQLLDEFEQHARATYPPDSVVWENGDFVSSTMLQWKGGYDDGRLGRWTQADVAEYMLDYFPRKVSADDETLAAVPECVRAFLGFLAVRGSLSGEPLEQLEGACEELRDEFLRSACDSSHWGWRSRWSHRCRRKGSTRARPARSMPGSRTSTPARSSSGTRSLAPPPTAWPEPLGRLWPPKHTLKSRRRSAARHNAKRASATGEADTAARGRTPHALISAHAPLPTTTTDRSACRRTVRARRWRSHRPARLRTTRLRRLHAHARDRASLAASPIAVAFS